MLDKAKDQFRRIFLHLLDHPDTSILIHCHIGKDRTGLFFVLLLGLCGVDEDIIANEFALTSLGIWGKYIYIYILWTNVERLIANGNNNNNNIRTEKMFGSRSKTIWSYSSSSTGTFECVVSNINKNSINKKLYINKEKKRNIYI